MQTHKNQFESAYGFQPSSLLDFYDELKEAGVFSEYNLELFTLNGSSRSKRKKSFYALLQKPNERFFNELQAWCEDNGLDIAGFDKTFYEAEGTPLMVLHDVRRIRTSWHENLSRYIMNIMKKNQEQNYEYAEIVFKTWEHKDKEQVGKEFLILLEMLDNTIYIHEGYRFPTYNPQIINQGKKFSTHLIDIDGYYWPVEIHFASRNTIKRFYDFPLKRRYKFSLTQSDWTRPIMIDYEMITACEDLSESSSVAIQDSDIFGALEEVNGERQEALQINGYTNIYLGFESLKKVIPISYLELNNINLIPVFQTKIQNQGIVGSYFFKNGQLKVQILVTNKKGEWTGNLRKQNYTEVVSQFQDEHLVLCRQCKQYLLTDMMKSQHRPNCTQIKQPIQQLFQKNQSNTLQQVSEVNQQPQNKLLFSPLFTSLLQPPLTSLNQTPLFGNLLKSENNKVEGQGNSNENKLFSPDKLGLSNSLFQNSTTNIFGNTLWPQTQSNQNQEKQQDQVFVFDSSKEIGTYPSVIAQPSNQIFTQPTQASETKDQHTRIFSFAQKQELSLIGSLPDQVEKQQQL